MHKYLKKIWIIPLYIGMTLVGRPSVCLPVFPFVRKKCLVRFPSLITQREDETYIKESVSTSAFGTQYSGFSVGTQYAKLRLFCTQI